MNHAPPPPEFTDALAEVFLSKGRRAEGPSWDATVSAYWKAVRDLGVSTVIAALERALTSDDPLPTAGVLRATARWAASSDKNSHSFADHLARWGSEEAERFKADGTPFVWLGPETGVDGQPILTSDGQQAFTAVEHREEWDPRFRAVCTRNPEWVEVSTVGRKVPPCLLLGQKRVRLGIEDCTLAVFADCRMRIMRQVAGGRVDKILAAAPKEAP